jgi:hypothetical protein
MRRLACLLGLVCACSAPGTLNESAATALLMRSKQFMAPLTVNVCEENPVRWSSNVRPADPLGTYLAKEREGRTLRALETRGLIQHTPLIGTASVPGQLIRVRLTESGRAAAVTPMKSGCGLPSPGTSPGRPAWAFVLATKKDVSAASLARLPGRATAFPTVRIQARWAWTLTALGRRLVAVLPQVGPDELPKEGAEGQSQEVARDDGAGWRLSGD